MDQANILTKFVSLQEISMPIPPIENSTSKIRVICLSNSAESAGGAVVYAIRKLMLAAKSKMMSATIPRNELLNTELHS